MFGHQHLFEVVDVQHVNYGPPTIQVIGVSGGWVTIVLLHCRRCRDSMSKQLSGKWSRSQLEGHGEARGAVEKLIAEAK